MMRRRKAGNRLAISVGFVTAVWLAAVSRWIVRDAVVPWDSKNQFYAFFRFLSATLRVGEWPFWNPYHYGGHPSVADPQSLVFAPVFVAWGMLDPAPTMRAFDLVVFAHLLAGGIAIAVMGWRARWPIPSSVLAAALFMLGGAASGRLQHTGIILGYGLFPIALLFLPLALERRAFFSAGRFAHLAAANIFGTHGSYWGPGAATLPEVALTDDSENYLFVGAVPVLLLLWFGIIGGGATRRGRRLMTCMLAIACLFMLGRYTPFYGLAFRFVPGIDLFPRPTDASFLFGIALAFLSAHRLADYVRKGLPRFRPLSTVVSVSAIAAVRGSAVGFSGRL